jgi:nitrite reductase (NADH) large subunit
MSKVLILGGGMSAGKLAEELVRLGAADGLAVAGEEGPGIYNRILLAKYAIEGEPEEFWTLPESWFAENRVAILAGRAAVAIDRSAKAVRFADGSSEGYETLVLALGSVPFAPPMKGLDLAGVHYLRSRADADRLRADLASPREVLVIGGGILGVETALEMREAGHSVRVAHRVPGLMERHLDLRGGRYLQRHLETLGLGVAVDDVCVELQAEGGRVARAVFGSGMVVETDLVLVSAGIRPRVELARDCGLEVGRGIKVDDDFRSSDPAIRAVGECMEWRGRTWGLLNAAYEQARALARSLAGRESAFAPADSPPTRLKAPIFAASLGALESADGDEVFVFDDPLRGVYKKVIVADGKIRGAQAVGAVADEDAARWDAVELSFSAGQELAESPGRMLFSSAATDAADPATWPDNLRVCECNGVSAGEIRAAIDAGARSFEAVMKATRAGTGCSSCRGRLRKLVESRFAPAARREGRWRRFLRAYREREIKGYTPYWIVSYVLDFVMLVAAIDVGVTGILKFPGLLALLGISIRRMPMGLFMTLHDWGGVAIIVAVLLHLVIHWGMMISFLRSMTRRRGVD